MSKLATLPGDDIRQIMWRYTDRYELQMVVQSARGVARGHVARMVADGVRNTHEWTERKNTLLDAFDASGLTALYMDTEQGGYIDGPKNFALCLTTFELSWVDAGAATCGLATNLALAPIHEKGTLEQRNHYMAAKPETLLNSSKLASSWFSARLTPSPASPVRSTRLGSVQ